MKISRARALVLASILATAVLASGAYFFQPWKLFIDTEVQESIPTSEQRATETTEDSTVEDVQPGATSDPIVLAQGTLISQEYQTSGTVRILQLEDGSRILRLEGLDTSDGPKVEVWITDAPVIEGSEGWAVFDDGNYVSLGAMKGNQGNQNYAIPENLDLSDFSSVSLWCVTFSVSFGAASLSFS